MILLELPRGYGKTTKLIEHSVATGIPILVRTTDKRIYYRQLARQLGYADQFPQPVTWSDCVAGGRVLETTPINEVLIDDLEDFVPELLWANLRVRCNYATISTENVVYQ